MSRRKPAPPPGDPSGIPLPCVLARHHEGDHDEELHRAVKEAIRCGAVARYVPREPEEASGSPEEYRQREEDEIQEGAPRSAPYQPPPEENVPAYEPVALDVGGDVVPGPVSPAPIAYPLIDAAILSVLRSSLAGLSLPGIVAKFPGVDADAVTLALTRALGEETVNFYLSDDEPPVRVYIEATVARGAPGEPVASAVAGEPEPPPSPEALTSVVVCETDAVMGAEAKLADARLLVSALEAAVASEKGHLARAIDAKARSLGPAGFCYISGVTFRAVPPRKPRGKPVDPSALWVLEEVKVAK